MSNANADLLRDDEWAATPESAAAVAVDAALKDVHTSMPGIVVSFDRAKLTARVTPGIKRVFVEQGAVNLPDLVDVPVVFPAGGGIVHTFDLSAGDEVLLHFSERCIDGWFQNGTASEPPEHRLHDLSDACASPSPFSQNGRAQSISGGVAAGGSEIRKLDGSVLLRVDGSNVWVGSKDPTPVTGARPMLIADLSNPSDPFTAWLKLLSGLLPGNPPPPVTGMTTIGRAK